jgi:hypothetical protein
MSETNNLVTSSPVSPFFCRLSRSKACSTYKELNRSFRTNIKELHTAVLNDRCNQNAIYHKSNKLFRAIVVSGMLIYSTAQ